MPSPFKVHSDLKKRLRGALKEDVGRRDISSVSIIPAKAKGKAVIIAKEKGILAGLSIAREIFRLADSRIKFREHIPDGSKLKRGKIVVSVEGNLRSILKAERVSLNFLQHLSGVATLTNAFVTRVRGTGAKIYDTRKTSPLWRDLEKYAVRVGGGHNHRSSLDEVIMIKDTHWDVLERHCEEAAGRRSLAERRSAAWSSGAVRSVRRSNLKAIDCFARLRRARNDRSLIIEVHSKQQLDIALYANPSVIMLDNWTPKNLRRGARYIKKWARTNRLRAPEIEASGGVNITNVRNIARSGVDRISIGAITHSAPALDFSLKVV